MKGDNNASFGPIQPKSGDSLTPLCRKSGFNKTNDAIQSKTRSRYNAAGGPNYKYSFTSFGDQGGNVHGYNPE